MVIFHYSICGGYIIIRGDLFIIFGTESVIYGACCIIDGAFFFLCGIKVGVNMNRSEIESNY